MSPDRLPKQVLYSQLSSGHRNRGRLRLRFNGTIKRNLKLREIKIDSWTSLSQQRDKWRATVKFATDSMMMMMNVLLTTFKLLTYKYIRHVHVCHFRLALHQLAPGFSGCFVILCRHVEIGNPCILRICAKCAYSLYLLFYIRMAVTVAVM